ncbi:MAG: phosphate ABC transporter substrate-binding protein [Thermodesulfobacteriota bacterium]
MRVIQKVFLGIALLAMALTFGPANAVAADSLKIVGSTTVYPLAEACVLIFKGSHKDAKIELSAGGSSVGIKSIIDGLADIGNASRDIQKKEIDLAKSKGVNPVKHVVALDCVVPIVHPSNPVSNLTIEQLNGIFTGKTKNWKEVGGKDEEIVVVSREDNSGTFDTWQHFVLKKDPLAETALKQQSNPAVRAYVAKSPKAIGYVGYGFAHHASTKSLKVNGVTASPETVYNKTYPMWRELFMFTNGEPKGLAKEFLDFVKSAKGQEIAEGPDAGFIKLKK